MKDDDDRNLVICQRASAGPADVPSVIRKCSECGHNVYVANSTLARLAKEGQGKPIVYTCLACMPCLPELDAEASASLRPSAEQLAEIEKALGRKLSEDEIVRGVEHFKSMYRASRISRN